MKNKSILDVLIEKNEFPIVFVGSGMSKRYLQDYPSWDGLLEELWKKTEKGNFFAHLNKMRNEIRSKEYLDDLELDFKMNTKVALEIEEKINEEFFNENIEIDGLEQRRAYLENISPFKQLLANRFSNYSFRENIAEEFNEYKKMLMKAQIIITTNYDTLIEDSYNTVSSYGISTYLGQQGFFKQTLGFAELYKIHGCTTDPKSLVMTEVDYENFDKNSVLISAKVISMLLHSPIIFLGYSLTDRNVRKMIKDFANSLSDEEKIEFEKRLIIVSREEGELELKEEVVIDKDLGCRMTVIRTDNYLDLYKKISSINQGVSPSEIRRYQHVIKEIIVERGKEGKLNTILVSPQELDNIDSVVGNKNIVVAIGDSKIIFNMPSIVDYIYDYVSEEIEQNQDTILRFIASQNPRAILPIAKYLSIDKINNSNLHENEKSKLKKRLEKHGKLNKQKESLQYRYEYPSLESIKNEKFEKYKEYSLIAHNIDKIPMDLVKEYILKEIKEIKDKGEYKVDTALRRLILIYDLKNNTTILYPTPLEA
ncbi:SIR2 family protein [Paraclostridium bifermentans]|uniref:SIR2 family protein n=1 Tax=Paraclostridium bifermentans TaxID=1490 RepID=UPI0024BB176D|nr:SIR2 family protein [Paraclostridium bifermentans]